MSEYQYYEWQTIDRVLTPEEQSLVNRLSSHIDVTASQAVVTYQWGDFKHDPKEVLLKYFDAHLYMANWGSRRLMFRFPQGLLDEEAVEQYCVLDYISFEVAGDFQVLDLSLDEEEGVGWVEAEGALSTFTRLRDDLLQGDFRLLYLAWLKAITLSGPLDSDEDDLESPVYDREPPVPAGLQMLTPALKLFMDDFDLDPFLIQAAAASSPDLQPAASMKYGELVKRLPRDECDDFLARLAEGDPSSALRLRKRLMDFTPKTKGQPQERRTIQQIFAVAKSIKQLERQRKEEEARRKDIAEMEAQAKREEQTWAEVEQLIQGYTAKAYDTATTLLEKLERLAEFQARQTLFRERVLALSEKYKTRSSLLSRWRSRGWL
jgi:hypothetical protein